MPNLPTLLTCAILTWLLAACSTVAPASSSTTPATSDMPGTTNTGNTFIVPAGWQVSRSRSATVLQAPEGGSSVTLVDVQAADADAAVAAGWAAVGRSVPWPLKVVTPAGPRDGWSDRRTYSYQTSPNERRDVWASVRRAGGMWTVAIYDMAHDIGEKRAAQINLIFGKLLPRGYTRETFVGRRAHPLTAERIAALQRFVQTAMEQSGVPGVSFGVVQEGKTVFAGGLGVRELGKPEAADADTRYMIASNTKAMATLMLGRLVDRGMIGWETPAIQLLPSFKLGDSRTTAQVKVKHLICACTGMPRRDMEWLLEFQNLTPEGAMQLLGRMQPTSGFGELFQYSNPLAAAAGFIGGHVAYPGLELGAAYDRAMRTEVFDPLGMKDTTHDFEVVRSGNVAQPHAPDFDGRTALAEGRVNLSIVPVRPAGGAWSSVNDVLKYVAMELASGMLPDGRRYMTADTLLARRTPQVAVSADISYGMGLTVNRMYGTPVVHHGGDMIGFHSDMMWLPEHDIGAVILTNGDPGWLIRTNFRRKLLEVLFDGRPEADESMAAQAVSFFNALAADRRLLTRPVDATLAAGLATRYTNADIGDVTVIHSGGSLRFDFGEWQSEMASRRNPDGSMSLLTTAPGFSGLEFVVGSQSGKRTMTMRDAQHEYVLIER